MTIDAGVPPPTFDADQDWRFPLRVGLPPTRAGTDLDFGPAAGPLRMVVLGVDGLHCDIAVARTPADLDVLAHALCLSANLVLIMGQGTVDRDLAVAAARGVGAIGYARTAYGPEQLFAFVRQLESGAPIAAALDACGPHELVADPGALTVAPLTLFRHSITDITPLRPDTRATDGRPRSSTRGNRLPPLAKVPTAEAVATTNLDDELDRRRIGRAATPRYLQAAVHRRQRDGTAGPRIAHGFLRGQPMTVLVGIGPLGPLRLAADTALDEQRLGAAGSDGWDLEITLKSDAGPIARRPLRLPVNGSSADVAFPLDLHSDAQDWCARVTVWHRARALQSAVLSGPVIESDTDHGVGRRLRLVVDGEFHPLGGLENHSAGGVTLELDTTPAVYTGSGDFLVEPREDEMRSAADRIATRLGEMAVELDEAADLNDPSSRALLEFLAVQGSLLLRAMFPDQVQRDAVSRERFLQSVRLSEAAPELPYEFIYDLPSPPRDFLLCTEWTDGIMDGVCPRCHAPGADNRDVLCPLGFWGLSKVIERHTAVGRGETRAQARLRRGDIAGRIPLQLKRAAFALSAKADTVPRGAPANYLPPSRRIKQALDTAGLPFDGPIADWRSWQDAINGSRPDLLIVLAHARFDDERGEWSMQIGTDSDLYLTRIFPEYVDTPPEIPGPVVFLFGCLTATQGSEQATFAREFRQRNASVVIGTTSTVLGRQAGPVAAGLVAAIKAAGATRPLGELLRRARGTGLAEGSVMAMALNAFGDADYRLTV